MAGIRIYGRCTCGNMLSAGKIVRDDEDEDDLNLVLKPCDKCMDKARERGVDSVQTAEPEEAAEATTDGMERTRPKECELTDWGKWVDRSILNIDARLHVTIKGYDARLKVMGESITERLSCLSRRIDEININMEED